MLAIPLKTLRNSTCPLYDKSGRYLSFRLWFVRLVGMTVLSVYQLASEFANARGKSVEAYMIEDKDHLKRELSIRNLYVYDYCVGAKHVVAADITESGANNLYTGSNLRRTVVQHHLDMGCPPINHPELPCIVVRRETDGFDFFPPEIIFYLV